jgi:hypothetical protein
MGFVSQCERGVDLARVGELSGVMLSLEEVRQSGRAAFFFDYCEALMYLDEALFEIRPPGAGSPNGMRRTPVPRGILDSGVGIEYGWRHLAECDCDSCAEAQSPGASH